MDKVYAPGDTALVVVDLDTSGEQILCANLIDHYRLRLELALLAASAALLLAFPAWT